MQLTLGVLRRKKNAESLLAAFDGYGEMLIRKQEAAWEEIAAEGLEMPNYRANLDEQRLRVQLATDRLETADDAHLEEDANDRALRRVRFESTSALVRILGGLSYNLDRKHGKGKADELLGLGPGLQPIPHRVRDVARRAANKLGDPDFVLPETEDESGVRLLQEVLKAEIEKELTRLTAALQELEVERRKHDLSLRAKIGATSHFDRTYSVAATWLKYALRSVGEDLLADRVRPTIPKTQPKDDEPGDGSEESSESSPAETSESRPETGPTETGPTETAEAEPETAEAGEEPTGG